MAFALTKVGPNMFTAAVGAPFTISATVDQGNVTIQAVTYDNISKTAAPFQFAVAEGSKNVGIVFAATQPTAVVSINEVDGANTQVLTRRSGVGNSAVLIIN
jgi:hypothetical protein